MCKTTKFESSTKINKRCVASKRQVRWISGSASRRIGIISTPFFFIRKCSTVLAARSNLYGVSARQRRVLPGTTQISYSPPPSSTPPRRALPSRHPRRRRRHHHHRCRRPDTHCRSSSTHTHTLLSRAVCARLCVCVEKEEVRVPCVSSPRRESPNPPWTKER